MTIIELGGGEYPEPGTINVDCLDLPTTHVKLNFCEEKLPFEDASVDGVVMNHSIEHIPLLKLEFVMNELKRVVKPGGYVRVRTPNLQYIIARYLQGQPEVEQPKDMRNWGRTLGQWNPAVWANLRLFSGQDYQSNTHFICYDYYMLKQMLEYYGFTDIEDAEGRDYQTGEIRIKVYRDGKSLPNS